MLRYDRVRGGGFAIESKYVADCIAKQLDAGVALSSIAVVGERTPHTYPWYGCIFPATALSQDCTAGIVRDLTP